MWTLTETTEQFYKNVPASTKQCVISNNGVKIVIFGREFNTFQTTFIYEHAGVKFDFFAFRADQSIDYDPTGKTFANFALGPVCKVIIDERFLATKLSDDDRGLIRSNITEFLTQEFHRCRLAVSPYPGAVIYV